MAEINTKLLDKIIRFQVDLRRLEASERKKIEKIVKQIEKGVLARLSGDEIATFNKRKLSALLTSISEPVSAAFAQMQDAAAETLDGVAKLQIKTAAANIDEVFVGYNAALPTAAVISGITANTLINGGPLADWWAKQESDTIFKFSSAIRQGMVLGENNQQIVRRIIGTRTQPGLLDITRNNANALVHTAVQTVANNARQAVYEQNSDVIQAFSWFSAMDSHVCWSADTLILMADGSYRCVGEVREGDYVIGGVTGKPCKVLFAGKRNVASSIVIQYNGDFIGKVTHDHPILTEKGWKSAESICLSSDIPQRKILCRNSEEFTREIKSTQNQRREGKAICDKLRLEEVRTAGCTGTGDCVDARGRFRDREGEDCGAMHQGTPGVQHDRWWRRILRCVRRYIKRECEKAFKTVQRRFCVPGTDAGCDTGGSKEGRDYSQEVQCHTRRTSYYQSENQPTVAGKGIEKESGTCADTRTSAESQRSDEGAMARPGIQKQGKCCTGVEAKGAAGGKRGLGKTKNGTDVEVHEGAMARPEIQGEGFGTTGTNSIGGSTETCSSDKKSKHDTREEGKDCGENTPTVGEAEAVTTGTITGYEDREPCEVVTLTIEGDPTYVAGCLIVHNCTQCMALSGREWKNDKGNTPIGHSVPFQLPPIHFNDRCVLLPVTKTFKQLGLDLPKLPPGERASSLGPISADTTFDEYLQRVSKTQQDEMLGKGRADLFREGKISLNQLLDGQGRELSLKELQQKYN